MKFTEDGPPHPPLKSLHCCTLDFIVQTGDPSGTGCGGESVYGKLYGDQASLFDASSLIYHSVNLLNCNYSLLLPTSSCLLHTLYIDFLFFYCAIDLFVIGLFFDVMYCTPFVDLQSQTLFGVQSGRIGAEEVINDTDGKEEVAKTQAILLEMVGNLPDAEVKPPENVLFVCKLNPMTIEEDLEIIFSRFGLSCEIIRDLKSGESLCYAFIEFEKNMFGVHLISICTMS
uniref:peptidylprolyl isomerase n=1 Tax=Oncorhynchus tshawytscha TaxID=74940 RepID=A0AAZ3SNZ9_ONCTS